MFNLYIYDNNNNNNNNDTLALKMNNSSKWPVEGIINTYMPPFQANSFARTFVHK